MSIIIIMSIIVIMNIYRHHTVVLSWYMVDCDSWWLWLISV